MADPMTYALRRVLRGVLQVLERIPPGLPELNFGHRHLDLPL